MNETLYKVGIVDGGLRISPLYPLSDAPKIQGFQRFRVDESNNRLRVNLNTLGVISCGYVVCRESDIRDAVVRVLSYQQRKRLEALEEVERRESAIQSAQRYLSTHPHTHL